MPSNGVGKVSMAHKQEYGLIRGIPLTCIQQSAGVSSEDNIGLNMDKQYWNTEIPSPYILRNNSPLGNNPKAEMGTVISEVTTEPTSCCTFKKTILLGPGFEPVSQKTSNFAQCISLIGENFYLNIFLFLQWNFRLKLHIKYFFP